LKKTHPAAQKKKKILHKKKKAKRGREKKIAGLERQHKELGEEGGCSNA